MKWVSARFCRARVASGAEIGFGPRFEDQGFGDPAHPVGARQDAHFGFAAEQRQAHAVLDREVARLRGAGEFVEFLQHPFAMALDKGLDLAPG